MLNRNPICSDYFQIRTSTETYQEWEETSLVHRGGLKVAGENEKTPSKCFYNKNRGEWAGPLRAEVYLLIEAGPTVGIPYP